MARGIDAREKAKAKRNRGQGAIRKAGMSDAQWCQKHDPLYKVKGKERHRKIKEIFGRE